MHCLAVDYTMHMQPGTQPPAGTHYGISRNELQGPKKYQKDNLSNRLILVLSFLTTTFVLFVKKPRNVLQFCADYCNFNALTIRNKYLLPLTRETLDRLCNIVYFTKLDNITAFNKICVVAGE